LTLEIYKLANFTYRLLPHYLGKCSKVIFPQYSAVISIHHHQLIFQTFPRYSLF